MQIPAAVITPPGIPNTTMAWSTLSTDEVIQEFTPSEKSALDAIQGKEYGETNLSGILTRSVRKFRGAVRAGGQTVSTTVDTIPDDIRDDVIAHARWKFLVAFPSLRALQTMERKDAHAEALKVIAGLREGTVRVENPDDSTATILPAPSFGTRGGSRTTDPTERDFTRENQDGI